MPTYVLPATEYWFRKDRLMGKDSPDAMMEQEWQKHEERLWRGAKRKKEENKRMAPQRAREREERKRRQAENKRRLEAAIILRNSNRDAEYIVNQTKRTVTRPERRTGRKGEMMITIQGNPSRSSQRSPSPRNSRPNYSRPRYSSRGNPRRSRLSQNDHNMIRKKELIKGFYGKLCSDYNDKSPPEILKEINDINARGANATIEDFCNTCYSEELDDCINSLGTSRRNQGYLYPNVAMPYGYSLGGGSRKTKKKKSKRKKSKKRNQKERKLKNKYFL